MVTWVQREAGQIASGHAAASLLSLLGCVVTLFAQRLPVARVPKQLLIPPVWGYVINHSGGNNVPALFVVGTQTVRSQECCPGFLPTTPIAALSTAGALVFVAGCHGMDKKTRWNCFYRVGCSLVRVYLCCSLPEMYPKSICRKTIYAAMRPATRV